MSLFGAFYRFRNRKAKPVSQMLRERDYLRNLGVDSDDKSQNDRSLLGSSKVIYTAVFMRCVARYRDDMEELNRLLENIHTDERAVFEYMKSELPNYQEEVTKEIERFIRKANDIMSSIGVRPS